jgi:hypothetical protein
VRGGVERNDANLAFGHGSGRCGVFTIKVCFFSCTCTFKFNADMSVACLN